MLLISEKVEHFNLLVIGKTAYKSTDQADIDKYPSQKGYTWLTGITEAALHLYFKTLDVKPISEMKNPLINN